MTNAHTQMYLSMNGHTHYARTMFHFYTSANQRPLSVIESKLDSRDSQRTEASDGGRKVTRRKSNKGGEALQMVAWQPSIIQLNGVGGLKRKWGCEEE